MPMDRDTHENLLNELNNPECTHERRTEILQELRTDYSTVLTDFDDITKSNDKLKSTNDDLVVANSKMFRELGYKGDTGKEKEVQEKEFSETVTLEQLENQN